MTHEVTGRHPAHTLRRCATSHSLPSFRRARGMSATRTRYFIVTPIRRSAAMTNEVTDRHPAQALRRCATTPKEPLSAPGERGDVRSADTILHSNPIRRSAAMTHGVTDRHHAHALRRCATTPKELLSAPRERGDVRSADALSVNPGLRPGQSNQRSMHRNAVPLRHNLVFG